MASLVQGRDAARNAINRTTGIQALPMIKTLIATSALALAALPAAVSAQDIPRGYVTLGYSQFDTGQSTLGAVTIRGGWKVWPNLGVEAEGNIGVEDETFDVSIGGTGGKIELKQDIAAYAVGFLPLGEHVELFARAGYGSTSVEASTPAVSVKGDGDSFNYGAGVGLFHGSNGLRADWTRKDFKDDGGETDYWSVSYVRRF